MRKSGKLLKSQYRDPVTSSYPLAVAARKDRVLELPSVRGPNPTLLVRDARTGKVVYAVFDHPTPAQRDFSWMLFSHDGKSLYVGGRFGHLYRCGVVAQPDPEFIGRHTQSDFTSIALSPDGKTLFSTGTDRRLRRWDTTTYKELPLPDGYRTRTWFALTPDGEHILVADHLGRVDAWSLRTGKLVKNLQRPDNRTLIELALEGERNSLVADGTAGAKPLLDRLVPQPTTVSPKGKETRIPFGLRLQRAITTRTGQALVHETFPDGLSVRERSMGKVMWNDPTPCLSWTADPLGRWLANCGKVDDDAPTIIRILDPATGQELRRITPVLLATTYRLIGPGFTTVAGMRAMPDGSRLVVLCNDGMYRLYDPTTGKLLTVG